MIKLEPHKKCLNPKADYKMAVLLLQTEFKAITKIISCFSWGLLESVPSIISWMLSPFFAQIQTLSIFCF